MSPPRDRGTRRAELERVKSKARIVSSRNSLSPSMDPDAKTVGKAAAVHGVACSCYMCGNPRKHYGLKTLGEVKADISASEED